MLKKSKYLVVKSNILVESRYELTLAEIRILLHVISMIKKDDKDFCEYRMSVRGFIDFAGLSKTGSYERAKQITRKLKSRHLDIPYVDEEGKEHYRQSSWLLVADYIKGEGYVNILLDPVLKPYLLELKERFTQYDIRNVIALKSSYSYRIYELLKQFEKLSSRTLSIDELRAFLSLEDKYKRYYDFKRYVLLQAQKDLKAHSDIYFDFEEIKEYGRAYTHIKFKIIKQESPTIKALEMDAKKTRTRKEKEAEELKNEYDNFKREKIEDFINNHPVMELRHFLTEFKVDGLKPGFHDLYETKGLDSMMIKIQFNEFIEKKYLKKVPTFEEYAESQGYELEKTEDGYRVKMRQEKLL